MFVLVMYFWCSEGDTHFLTACKVWIWKKFLKDKNPSGDGRWRVYHSDARRFYPQNDSSSMRRLKKENSKLSFVNVHLQVCCFLLAGSNKLCKCGNYKNKKHGISVAEMQKKCIFASKNLISSIKCRKNFNIRTLWIEFRIKSAFEDSPWLVPSW